MHRPVLVEEAIDALNIQPNGKYIDATAGEGGHLKEMVRRGGTVLAIDADKTQIERLQDQLKDLKGITFAVGNFATIDTIAKGHDFDQADGVLFDFGLSMYQLNNGGRGFSYKQLDDPLDMRMNTRLQMKASDIVNVLTREQLYELFVRNSEEQYSAEIADAIVQMRGRKRINYVAELLNAIDSGLKNKNTGNQFQKNGVYSRIFQALRIEVNDEFANIRKGLERAVRIMKKGGRIAVITFHSLEDRNVKKFIRTNKYREVYKKVIQGDKELRYERSAKLRVIEL